jgi:hypothetical protein
MEWIRRKLATLVAGQKIAWPEPMPTHWRPGGGKIFCVGRNKTGTTSLERAFKDLDYVVADYVPAKLLTDEFYFERRFTEFVEFCKGAQVFQDVPFSYPYVYVYLDQVFPGSKFILSVRDDAEQWYRSITRFHGKLFGTDGATPTAEQVKNATYGKFGFGYNIMKVHGTSDEDPYNKQTMIDHYNAHNKAIEVYFEHRPDDLLVVNLAKPEDYKRFVEFLGVSSPHTAFPKENVT